MRLSRDDMFMEIAHTVAKRGTCSRAQVGAVIVRDGRIISIGYNGAPRGMPHCDHSGDKGVCSIAIHAEMNAIIWGARAGIPIDSSVMYATHSPCYTCAVAMVAAGIKGLWYEQEYRLKEGLLYLFDANVELFQHARDGRTVQDAEGHGLLSAGLGDRGDGSTDRGWRD